MRDLLLSRIFALFNAKGLPYTPTEVYSFCFGWRGSPNNSGTSCDIYVDKTAPCKTPQDIIASSKKYRLEVKDIENNIASLHISDGNSQVILRVFYVDTLPDNELVSGIPCMTLDAQMQGFVKNAQTGKSRDELPLGYSRLLEPNRDVYYAVMLWGLYADVLERTSIEAFYKMLDMVDKETIHLDELSSKEISVAEDYLEQAFQATWAEEFRHKS